MSRERRFLGPNSPASSRATSSIVPICDQLSQAGLVESGAGEVLGQDPLERPVLLLDRIHRVVDDLADLGRLGGGLELPPSGVWRHPEHVLAHVLVAVLRVDVRLLLDGVVPLLEGVEDVLEEYKPEGDVLVLACVHVPAHLIRRGPELLVPAEIRTVARAGPLRPRLLLAPHVWPFASQSWTNLHLTCLHRSIQ